MKDSIVISLKQRIEQTQQKMSANRTELNALEQELRDLDNSRVNCIHEWDTGVKGWEHEGKYCKKCGINDMYAVTLKKHLDQVAKNSAQSAN